MFKILSVPLIQILLGIAIGKLIEIFIKLHGG